MGLSLPIVKVRTLRFFYSSKDGLVRMVAETEQAGLRLLTSIRPSEIII